MAKNARQKQLQAYTRACEAAAKKREVNREHRDRYREDSELRELIRKRLIKDLVRVFNHPSNPYQTWAASRKRYRELGHFPEIMVTDLFGTHSEFERAAGLRDRRGTTAVKNATAKISTEKSIRRYAEAHVLKHVGKWDKKLRERKGVKEVLVVSDLHSQFLDPFAWEVFLDVAKMVEPDLIVLNGDVADFPKVGRYTQMPGAGNLSLQDEIDFVRDDVLKPLREQHPDTPITWHIGNHEQRLVRYLADTAPALAVLRCMQFDNLFGVDEFEVEMVFGGNFLAPTQKERKDNIRRTWKIYYDCFAVTHGVSIAKNAPEQELARYGCSGTSGHTHRPQVITVPTLKCPTASWTSTGMMAGFAVGKDYVPQPSAWTMGFGHFTIDAGSGTVVPNPVLIYEDFATFSGHVWRPTKAALSTRLRMWGENGDVTGHRRAG